MNIDDSSDRGRGSNEAAAPILGSGGDLLADAGPALAHFLARSRTAYYLAAQEDGTVRSFNAAFAERLKLPPALLHGELLWARLTDADARVLRQRLRRARQDPQETFLLNFVDAEQAPFTLECQVTVGSAGFVLLGEAPTRHEEALQAELLLMNNHLAVLARENERKRKSLQRLNAELEEALAELRTTYWHLKKIQEVLPICMECGRVRTGESRWDEVVAFLEQNARFLSHCYCPDCFGRMAASLEG